MPETAKEEVLENYGSKERGYVQPYSEYIDEMIDYIDTYAVDEPSITARRQMLKDAQVKAVTAMLVEAVLSGGWDIHYNWDTDKELGTQMVNFLYEAFGRINSFPWAAGGIEDLIEKWMDALWYKKMACELVYQHDKVQEYIFVHKAKVLPPESIKLPSDEHGNLLAIQQFPFSIDTSELTGTGRDLANVEPVSMDMNRMLLWVNGDDYSQYEGKSELDPVYKYWFLKDFILKFWSMFVERFGAPLLIAFVKAKNMKKARDGLKNIVSDTSFALEEKDKLEIVEPKKEGEVFKMMISYCDNEITKGLLMPVSVFGDVEGGGKGLGDLHFKFFEYRIEFIQRKLQNLMRALIKKLIDLNFPNVKHYPVFTFKPLTVTKRLKMAQAFDLLVQNALIHPLEPWIREELQLPEISDDFKDDLDEAWRAKMTAGGIGTITTPPPDAAVTRPEAQTNQRQPKETGEALADDQTARIKAQLDSADGKFSDFLIPTVRGAIKDIVALVESKIKDDPSIEFAETPVWLKNLEFQIQGLGEGFLDLYDEILVDISLGDNRTLTNLGMKSAFDTQTRSGAFKWIDKQMTDIRSGLIDYGSENANELQSRILADTKAIVQAGLDEGLRGRDVVDNLRSTLLGSNYTDAQLMTVVRTNTTAIVNQGKKGFARANAPFVRGMVFRIIEDNRTTDICLQRKDKEFALNDPELDANTPPLHFSCRSILDYLTEGSPAFNPAGITEPIPEGFGDAIG